MEFNKDLVGAEVLGELVKMQEAKYISGFIDECIQKENIARFEENINKEKIKENMEVIGKSKGAEEQGLKMTYINIKHNAKVLEMLKTFQKDVK